jgi:hypothetical protein
MAVAEHGDHTYDEDKALLEQALSTTWMLTDIEWAANREFLVQQKIDHSKDDVSKRMLRKWSEVTPEIQKLIKGGEVEFRRIVGERLRKAELAQECAINRCPLCRKVVRTALAQQCLWCGADWHKQKPT